MHGTGGPLQHAQTGDCSTARNYFAEMAIVRPVSMLS